MKSVIKRILFIVTILLLMLTLLLFYLTKSNVCGQEIIYNDKNFVLYKQSLCYGGALGGVDVALVVSYKGKTEEILKTYSNNGVVCVSDRNGSIYIYTDFKKIYFVKNHISFGKKKIMVFKIPYIAKRMQCSKVGY